MRARARAGAETKIFICMQIRSGAGAAADFSYFLVLLHSACTYGRKQISLRETKEVPISKSASRALLLLFCLFASHLPKRPAYLVEGDARRSEIGRQRHR